MADVGSARKCTIAGITYRILGDADLSQTPTAFENTSIATSGDALFKEEKRPQNVEDLILATSPDEIKTLKRVAEGDPVALSYQESNGYTWRATGRINIDTRTTMEGRATVTLLAKGDWA